MPGGNSVTAAWGGLAGVWGLTGLLLLAGCAVAPEGRPVTTSAAGRVDYGPNPLADALRWPRDSEPQTPLYAP